jgi:hypothetical protein
MARDLSQSESCFEKIAHSIGCHLGAVRLRHCNDNTSLARALRQRVADLEESLYRGAVRGLIKERKEWLLFIDKAEQELADSAGSANEFAAKAEYHKLKATLERIEALINEAKRDLD